MKLECCNNKIENLGTCVFQIGEAKLVFTNYSDWVVSFKQEILGFLNFNNNTPLYLYPLLEVKRDLVYAHLNAVSQENILMKEIIDEFPELKIVLHVLEHSVSDYWPLKALEWIESSLKINSEIKEQLIILQSKSWAGQKLRHKTRLIIKMLNL